MTILVKKVGLQGGQKVEIKYRQTNKENFKDIAKKIATDYNKGMEMIDIVAKYGKSVPTIYRYLRIAKRIKVAK